MIVSSNENPVPYSGITGTSFSIIAVRENCTMKFNTIFNAVHIFLLG